MGARNTTQHEREPGEQDKAATGTRLRSGRLNVYAPILADDPGAVARLRKKVRHIPAERVILREHARPHEAYVIYSGWAYSYKTLPDGSRQIITFCTPGNLLCFEALVHPGLAYEYGIRSLTPLTLCVFDIDAARASLVPVSQAQMNGFWEMVHRYHNALIRKIAGLGRSTAKGRLCQLLLEIHERLRVKGLLNGARFAFPVTHAHLADALGVTDVYVGRLLGDLRNAHIFELENGIATILDDNALRAMAQDN